MPGVTAGHWNVTVSGVICSVGRCFGSWSSPSHLPGMFWGQPGPETILDGVCGAGLAG